MHARYLFGSLLFVSFACASTPAPHAPAMGAAAHEAEAAAHERAAAEEAAAFESSLGRWRTRCLPNAVEGADVPCWTRRENPTQEHLDRAAAQRRLAAEHRAAAQTLRDAEARACAGVPEGDLSTSPLQRSADILTVEPLLSWGPPKPFGTLEGAAIVLRAVPGLTYDYMRQLVACHLARNAAMGFALPEMASCPLSVPGATATVEASDGGFRIEVRGDDAEEILARAHRLAEDH
ncbi:MAG TPA: hypothetical protein VHB21_24150 [Minicystis sp.]|nr:hypothetical protein [Minicystis sp.]